MGRWICLLVSIALVLGLLGCVGAPQGGRLPTTQATIPRSPSVATDPAPSVPEHSPLYLPHCTTEQMLEYFEEVVLRIEYSDGTGNPALVQKWLSPIRFRIRGDATQTDLTVLSEFFEQLNQIPGFPGIREAGDGEPAELTLHFLGEEDFKAMFSEVVNGEDAYGATQFWYYTASNEIYTADIGYRTDMDQATRNSVLIEEIINTLGITDTVVRTDSIVYQYSNDNTTLSDVDWVILWLLYDPAIRCGMDLESCSAVIAELYR